MIFNRACPRCRGSVKVQWGESATCIACGWEHVSHRVTRLSKPVVEYARIKKPTPKVEGGNDNGWDNIVATYEGD